MPAYDDLLISPPAPVAKVILRNPSTSATVSDAPMLLDSGADVTLVPRASVERLGLDLDSGEAYELTGFDGRTSVAQAVQLDLVFLGRTFKGRYLLLDQEWGLMGRDVLNHLSLLFHGPRLYRGEARYWCQPQDLTASTAIGTTPFAPARHELVDAAIL